MSTFFINRPIFAWVIALGVMLAGVLSVLRLPINQYPDIAAPAISIDVTYPGASAETVENTVVRVIEQQLTGIDNLRYIQSTSSSDGSVSIVATFNQGTDADTAQVQVQNKVSKAQSQLPTEVVTQGITVAKYQTNFMLVLALTDDTGRLNDADLNNLIVSTVQDPVARTNGVGAYMVMGSEYAMRIWLDPAKLYAYQLMPSDVSSAISAQNVQVSAGKLGGLPTLPSTQIAATVRAKDRLQSVEQFQNILLKVTRDGAQVRLRDVATVALGPEDYSISAAFNGKPAAGIALRLASGANLLQTVEAVKATMASLQGALPKGVSVHYPYETAPVVSASIDEVIKTLAEAMALVFLVMLLFLQKWRATVIPALSVPVVLLGTCGVLAAFGYTLNTLTLFGMVLAIGLLVDDAIVVVENVERVMHEKKVGARQATLESMQGIQGALVGIAMVISAVLVPMAFFSGSTGIIYRQFSITIVSAMLLSVLVALVFIPALCATLLRPHPDEHDGPRWARAFNQGFGRATDGYVRCVRAMLTRRRRFALAYVLIVVATAFLFTQVPKTFLPDEDQGVLMMDVSLPENASAIRTQQVLDEIQRYVMSTEQDQVDSIFVVNGFSFSGRGQNAGIAFIGLKDWAQRQRATQRLAAVAERLNAHFATLEEARVFVMVPPAVMELGNATGFDFYLRDELHAGHAALMQARNKFLELAAKDPRLSEVRPNGMNDEPQYQLQLDDERITALGLSLTDVNATLSSAWGSSYVNQFIYQDRVKKVYIQGKASARVSPNDFNQWYVRNSSGEMVPFSAFSHGEWSNGSPRLERFNGLAATEIMGSPGAGYSSGDAVQAVKDIVKQIPGFSVQWNGLSYEEQLSGNQAPLLYALSLLVVFLCLAALYESWSVPFAVILVVPLGIVGTIAAVMLRGLSNDVFFQVGLLTTVGLAAKNAILIVEFAKTLNDRGMPLMEAAAEAARLRIRPIIMTSMAFILGVLPLTISSGAGAGSQHSIGTAVIGGMLSATFLAIFFVPLFFTSVTGLLNRPGAQSTRSSEVSNHE